MIEVSFRRCTVLTGSVSVIALLSISSYANAQQTVVGSPDRGLQAGTISTTTGTIINRTAGAGVTVLPGNSAVITAIGAVIDRSTMGNTAALEISSINNDVSPLTINLSGSNLLGTRSAVGLAISQPRPVTFNATNSTFTTVGMAGAAIDASGGDLTVNSVGNVIRAGAIGLVAQGGRQSGQTVVVNSVGGSIEAADGGIIADAFGGGSVSVGQGAGITTRIALAPRSVFTSIGIQGSANNFGTVSVRTGAGGTIDGGTDGILTTTVAGSTSINVGASIGGSTAPTRSGVNALSSNGGAITINNTAAIRVMGWTPPDGLDVPE